MCKGFLDFKGLISGDVPHSGSGKRANFFKSGSGSGFPIFENTIQDAVFQYFDFLYTMMKLASVPVCWLPSVSGSGQDAIRNPKPAPDPAEVIIVRRGLRLILSQWVSG